VLEGQNVAVPAGLHCATQWPRASEGGVDAIADWLKGHTAARLVIVDTLARIRDRRRSEGSLYEEDYDAIARLKDLGDRQTCAILVVHHTRKGEAEDPFDTISGTLGLTGAADVALVLQRPRRSCTAHLHVTGRDVDEQRLALRWAAEHCVWLEEEEDDQEELTPEKRAVIEALRGAAAPLQPAEVALRIGKTRDAVRQLMRRMAEQGLLRSDAGLYALQGTGTTDVTAVTGEDNPLPQESLPGDSGR
jgi:hypothetical protein